MSWVWLLLIYYSNVFVVSGDRVNPNPFYSNLSRIKSLLNFWLHARHCRLKKKFYNLQRKLLSPKINFPLARRKSSSPSLWCCWGWGLSLMRTGTLYFFPTIVLRHSTSEVSKKTWMFLPSLSNLVGHELQTIYVWLEAAKVLCHSSSSKT